MPDSAICPKCGKTIEAPAGTATCDTCGATVQIPAPAESPPAASSTSSAANSAASSSSGPDFKTVATHASRIAGEKTKIAMSSTVVALGILVKNPTQGISEAYEKLGPQKSLYAGVFCGVIFAVSMMFFSRQFWWFASAGDISLNFVDYCKIFLSAGVLFLCLAGTLFLCRLVGRGKGRWTSDIFVAGIALFPTAVALLFAGIFGANGIDIDVVLGLIAECLMVLILFHAFRDLSGLSPNFSAYAVPVALLVSGYVAKVLLGSML